MIHNTSTCTEIGYNTTFMHIQARLDQENLMIGEMNLVTFRHRIQTLNPAVQGRLRNTEV